MLFRFLRDLNYLRKFKMATKLVMSSRMAATNIFRVFSTSCSRYVSSGAHSVSLTQDGRKMELLCEDATETKRIYHGMWLRHNCRCPECYSEPTNMLKLRICDASSHKVITSAKIDGCNLLIKWRNTDHEGTFPLQWLKDNDYSSEESRRERNTLPEPLIAESFPVSDFTDIISSDEGTLRWLKTLDHYGFSLIKGIPQPETSSQQLAKLFPHLLDYLGERYDVMHKENIDDLGEGTGALKMHQDLIYYENPPGIQVLNCLRNDPCVEGGESIVLDLYPIVKEIQVNHPKSFEILTSVPVTFQRVIMGHYDKSYLKMTRRHIELDSLGQIIGINWNTAHCDPICIDESLVEDYYEAMTIMENLMENSNLKMYHRLVPGECLVFNNRRMVHGRKAFIPNGGQRHFNGFYVHTDYLRSQLMVLSKKLGKKEVSANTFMSSCY